MDLQKLNVKLFVKQPNEIALTDFIEIFHGWIQATDGNYHDVADYSHMKGGPGIVLVANNANVSIDESGGRRGLLFNQKSRLSGSNQEKLRQVFQAAIENCLKLEAEPALRGKLRFAGNEAWVAVNDRLPGMNSPNAFETIKGDIESFAKRLFGTDAVTFASDRDSRQRLSVRVRTSVPADMNTLWNNLEHN
jgi:hypothetical protein